MRRPGPYSTADAIASLDRRSKEYRLMAGVRAEMAAHVGGKPSATQKALIERVAWLTLHMAKIDAKAASGGSMSDHDHRHYLAWANTMARTMRTLGLDAAPQRPLSPAEAMARTPIPSRGVAA
jgi:hypothetical protein